MAKYLSQKELVEKISENISKIETAQMDLQGIEAHLDVVRELYERTIALRYKAFEAKTSVAVTPSVKVEVAPMVAAQEPEIIVTNTFEEPAPIIDETPKAAALDFDIFDAPSTVEEEISFSTEEDPIIEEIEDEVAVFEPIEQAPVVEEQPNIPTPIVNTPIEAPVTASSISSDFVALTQTINNKVKNQIGFMPLDSLVGSFGLNERLLFINELFDGSSEAFSDAIKHLDARHSLSEAAHYLNELGSQYAWETDNETLEEFIQKLCRRFE
ncbi:MAG: hypothetical protein R2779_01200 [Crocinitomicaceae bacterium]